MPHFREVLCKPFIYYFVLSANFRRWSLQVIITWLQQFFVYARLLRRAHDICCCPSVMSSHVRTERSKLLHRWCTSLERFQPSKQSKLRFCYFDKCSKHSCLRFGKIWLT